jgi:Septum formation
MLAVFVLSGLIVLGALALGFSSAHGGANNGTNPVARGPITHPNDGTTAAAPATPLTTPAARPTMPAMLPTTPAARQTTPAAAPVPWTPATAMPSTGPDATRADVFATIKVGTCLAETPDLRSIIIVPCLGPHTDEVTLVRDLTVMFATMPTDDQIQTLSQQLCPAAAHVWTGGTDERYDSGYLWQFEDGVPGQVVRGFACTVTLAGHSPFSGTLRRAAA